MADGTLPQDAAGAVDHVVRGQACGLVENENTIHAEI